MSKKKSYQIRVAFYVDVYARNKNEALEITADNVIFGQTKEGDVAIQIMEYKPERLHFDTFRLEIDCARCGKNIKSKKENDRHNSTMEVCKKCYKDIKGETE